MVLPVPGAQVFVDADAAGKLEASGVVGKNESEMSCLRDHRIVPVTAALAEASRMHMNVSDDSQPQAAALFPDQPELSTVELDNATREAGGVDVVVIEEMLDFPDAAALRAAEKESPAFAASARPAMELFDAPVPEGETAHEFRRPADC